MQLGYLVATFRGEKAAALQFLSRFHLRQLEGGVADRDGRQLAIHGPRSTCLDLLRLVNQPEIEDGYACRTVAERFLVLQIEDPEPMDDLDAIAALEGVDILFFGPGDYSHAIGVPGELDHPEVRRARRRVAEACAAHGKVAGTVATPASVAETAAMGYQFLSMGADVVGLAVYCRELVAAFPEERAGDA